MLIINSNNKNSIKKEEEKTRKKKTSNDLEGFVYGTIEHFDVKPTPFTVAVEVHLNDER